MAPFVSTFRAIALVFVISFSMIGCGGSTNSSNANSQNNGNGTNSANGNNGQNGNNQSNGINGNQNQTNNAGNGTNSANPSQGKPGVPIPQLTITPASTISAGAVTVTIKSDQPTAPIRYTTDGSEPNDKNGKIYSAPITVDSSAALKIWSALPEGTWATKTENYTVGEVYVAPGSSGNGSWSAPYGTIAAAITKAKTLGIRTVRVLAGTFRENLTIENDILLSGGWRKVLGGDRGTTVLRGVTEETSSQANPSAAIKVNANGALTLENFEIHGSSSSFGAALAILKDGAATVKRSQLTGGDGSYSYGVRSIGATKLIVQDSRADGGDGGSTFGISSDGSNIQVLRSVLGGGTGTAVSYALSMTGSKGSVSSTVLAGGAANASYGAALYSSPTVALQNCTLLGGTGNAAYAVFIAESEPEIVNCLIGSTGKTKSFGIYENYGNSSPKRVEANAFFGAASGLYFDNDIKGPLNNLNASGAFSTASGKTIGAQSKNVKAEPVLAAAPDYTTKASSPSEILTGGLVLSGDAATDRNGKSRGAVWSIGAYQVK